MEKEAENQDAEIGEKLSLIASKIQEWRRSKAGSDLPAALLELFKLIPDFESVPKEVRSKAYTAFIIACRFVPR